MNKLYFITDKTSPEMKAINEVLPRLNAVDDVSGIPVMLKRIPEGLTVTKDVKGYTIGFSTRISLIRAVGLLVENLKKKELNIEEKPKFDTVGTMPDCSRNAMLTVDSLKEWIRVNSLMGLNAMMLYTEDTYEIEEQPYFGYMRGRFTAEEIKEIDDYAFLMGIELVPCIQTLAHLRTLFLNGQMAGLRDADGILLVGDERVYKLIDDMLDTCSKNFRSRRINLGMDEAFLLGSGTYMQKNGYTPRSEIMRVHLDIVVQKCKDRGLQPMIWSDMFFRMIPPTGGYYRISLECIPENIVKLVPEGLKLLYWDYYSIDRNRYNKMFDLHADFVNNATGFAGGAVCWYGVVPLNTFSVESARAATECAIAKGCKDAWITMWGDDGSACAHFATFPTLQIYAEACWSGNTTDEHAEIRMKTCTGASYKDFLEMEQVNNVPGRTDYGKDIANPYKYMLYQDILNGKFDCHIPEGIAEHYAEKGAYMKKLGKRNKDYEEIYKTLASLCSVLEIKASLGVDLKKAYDADDKEALKNFADKVIPELIKRYEKYYADNKAMWDKYNRPCGFEVQDIRFGALIQRAKNVRTILLDYVSGKTQSIPELAVKRIPFDPALEGKALKHQHFWCDIVTANILSRF
ncbi:MAG: beta-N-acetylhexosaminidase [Clostridia bacterium]|nr:beta-N-acetylhexosaminidase [Clostridia bacterium]